MIIYDILRLFLSIILILVFKGECIRDDSYTILQYSHTKYFDYSKVHATEYTQTLTPQGTDWFSFIFNPDGHRFLDRHADTS